MLAQAAATRGGAGAPPAALRWLGELAGACRMAIEDRFPFVPGAGDADYATLAAFLSEDGALARFITVDLASALDTEAIPWAWKPEARLSGFEPASAAFLERATRAGRALFPEGAGQDFSLSMLARTGEAAPRATLGGAGATIDPAGAPSRFAWPGKNPAAGFGLRADGGGGETWPGPWGLLRFLDGARPRARDDGRRFILDSRATGERIFFEMDFAGPENIAAARAGLRGLACPRQL